MLKLGYIIVVVLMIISLVVFFLLKDVENIHQKGLIKKDEAVYLYRFNTKLLFDGSNLKSILNDEGNTWSFSIASYATDNFLVKTESGECSLYFKIDSGYIVLNYKHKYLGWVQLVSEKEFTEFKNIIK